MDLVYQIAGQLPRFEKYNRKSQIVHFATSITLNIAEGSTSQTHAEQGHFLGMAIPSPIETVARLRLIERQKSVEDGLLIEGYPFSENRFAKLQAFQKSPERPYRGAE